MAKTVLRSKKFEKHYRKRIAHDPKLKQQFAERLALFVRGERGPPVNDHALIGNMEGLRAFSVSGDIRVLYTENGDDIILFDTGTHNQVY